MRQTYFVLGVCILIRNRAWLTQVDTDPPQGDGHSCAGSAPFRCPLRRALTAAAAGQPRRRPVPRAAAAAGAPGGLHGVHQGPRHTAGRREPRPAVGASWGYGHGRLL